MKKIILIAGKACAGKDTLVKAIMKEMNLTESEIQGYEMVVEVLAKALDIIDRQYRIKYKQFRIKGEPVDNEDQIYQLYWNQTIATEKGLQSYLELFRKRNAQDAADNAATDNAAGNAGQHAFI